MTQPPSPSAVALDLIEEFIDEIAALPSWDKARRRKSIAAFGCAIDALTAQSVAAERAKPAASDLEAAMALMRKLGGGFNEQEWVATIAAALAERGRVERERAAEIAEHIQELEDAALGIPAAIRNQTGG